MTIKDILQSVGNTINNENTESTENDEVSKDLKISKKAKARISSIKKELANAMERPQRKALYIELAKLTGTKLEKDIDRANSLKEELKDVKGKTQ